jgi:CubicO group peptidase (beta-lactamase class C family)
MKYKPNLFPILLFCCIAIAFGGCEKDLIQVDIDTELERLFNEYQLPSLAAGVFTEDGMQWATYLGYADISQAVEADEETIYHIASISKVVIATAILQLEEQGRLSLDEDVNAYLPISFRHPDFPDIPITPRMLLTHTAGLVKPGTYNSQQGMWNPFPPDEGPAPSIWVPEFLTPSGANYDPNLWLSVPPGTHEVYSNVGICVAAYLVEALSGMEFRAYCKAHIFDPLEMNSTSYNYGDLNQEKIALLYDNRGHGTPHLDDRVYAAGGVKSTVNDLMRFALCYLHKGVYAGERILSETSIDQLLALHNPASGRCLAWQAYGGGWFGHLGGLELGAATTLFIHPERKVGFIIFTNAHEGVVNPGGAIFDVIKQKANAFLE